MQIELGKCKEAEVWGFGKGIAVAGLVAMSFVVRIGFSIVFMFVAVALTWDMIYSWLRVRKYQ